MFFKFAHLRSWNDEKAWNDPPVFAYTQTQDTPAAAPKRTLLNRRVPFPQDGPPPTQSPAPSTILGALPPAGPLLTTSCTTTETEVEQQPSFPEDLKGETLECLTEVMERYLGNVEKRKVDEVQRRADILKSMWEQGKLSDAVQRKTFLLVSELHKGNVEQANKLHVSLMVDYVSEVSQWMIGIKRLILAAQDGSSTTKDDS
ncbi:steroid receptor RNA activator 1-like isoform X2 [Ornithodoros turicata]|uniref:steroid receptor RNA activator 1-like isoform X2 n=1 Tax=Ornithodoros turicata TaxID=34597 RepID=UPI00313882D7